MNFPPQRPPGFTSDVVPIRICCPFFSIVKELPESPYDNGEKLQYSDSIGLDIIFLQCPTI